VFVTVFGGKTRAADARRRLEIYRSCTAAQRVGRLALPQAPIGMVEERGRCPPLDDRTLLLVRVL
jgi:hypothetical protein